MNNYTGNMQQRQGKSENAVYIQKGNQHFKPIDKAMKTSKQNYHRHYWETGKRTLKSMVPLDKQERKYFE